jgi:hypothetical protein
MILPFVAASNPDRRRECGIVRLYLAKLVGLVDDATNDERAAS